MDSMFANRSKRRKPFLDKRREIAIIKTAYMVFFISVAAVFAFAAYYVTSRTEIDNADTAYDQLEDQLREDLVERFTTHVYGAHTMATSVGSFYSSADAWPLLSVSNFEGIADSMLNTTGSLNLALYPLVSPSEITQFNDFAYDFYENNYPAGTGVSSVGKGIFSTGEFNGSTVVYRDTTGETFLYDSKYDILTPLFQSSRLEQSELHQFFMFNFHSIPQVGQTLDDILDCAALRVNDMNLRCGRSTELVLFNSQDPSTFVYDPIYPADNDTEVVGFIGITIRWKLFLNDVFDNSINGILCVLEVGDSKHVYSVENGQVEYLGETSQDVRSSFTTLLEITDNGLVLTNASSVFILKLYRLNSFDADFTSNTGTKSCIIVASVFLLSYSLFYLYDFLVKKEFDAGRQIVEAKRRFVRFISHEVRTPLNCVHMGLKLLTEEIETEIENLENMKSLSSKLQRLQSNSESIRSTRSVKSYESNSSYSMPQNNIHEKLQEWLVLNSEIMSSAKSAIDVLNDILNYDKIEAGRMSLELNIVDIWEIIEETVNEFRLPARKANVEMNLDFGPLISEDERPDEYVDEVSRIPPAVRDLKVLGDCVRLTQVLRNLISNAIKFTPEEGSITVTVRRTAPMVDDDEEMRGNVLQLVLTDSKEVTCFLAGGIVVEVKDTGSGLSAEQVQRLFREGVQFNVNALQHGNGSGLGLFIAKGITDQHGGSITADSDGLKLGTTMTLKLPLIMCQSPDDEYMVEREDFDEDDFNEMPRSMDSMPPSRQPLAEADANKEVTGLRILVVDDTGMNRKLLIRLLEKKQHMCDEARDGIEAIERFKESLTNGKPYDTILMDSEMPNMNGPYATKVIRELGCKCLIVGITGNVLPEDVAHFEAYGANAVFPKPFSNMADLEALWRNKGTSQQRVTSIVRHTSKDFVFSPDVKSRGESLTRSAGDEESGTPMRVLVPKIDLKESMTTSPYKTDLKMSKSSPRTSVSPRGGEELNTVGSLPRESRAKSTSRQVQEPKPSPRITEQKQEPTELKGSPREGKIQASANSVGSNDKKGNESAEITGLHLLVVDDVAMMRKMMIRILGKKTHTCDEAKDGVEAVDKYRASLTNGKPYDSILMDSEMPNMTGPEAARKMREIGCKLPIIGITGNVLPEDIAHYESYGADAVLPKPLNLNDLGAIWIDHGVGKDKDKDSDENSSNDAPINESSSKVHREGNRKGSVSSVSKARTNTSDINLAAVKTGLKEKEKMKLGASDSSSLEDMSSLHSKETKESKSTASKDQINVFAAEQIPIPIRDRPPSDKSAQNSERSASLASHVKRPSVVLHEPSLGSEKSAHTKGRQSSQEIPLYGRHKGSANPSRKSSVSGPIRGWESVNNEKPDKREGIDNSSRITAGGGGRLSQVAGLQEVGMDKAAEHQSPPVGLMSGLLKSKFSSNTKIVPAPLGPDDEQIEKGGGFSAANDFNV